MHVESLTSTLFDGEGMHCHQPAALHLTHPDTMPKQPSDTVGKAGLKLRLGGPIRLMPSLSLRLETDRFTVMETDRFPSLWR
ncbi:hypothetical protein AQJ91_36695 [Streptomyces dysideae]|uniref:Uncharacterized protein n=2 Tax=Streptomyces dysideae TaxID=909626 RepID=A0A117RY55_9ACTN|nr:hypothetical protein AQJ91_36695 [Streptomyces dysideae]